MRASWWSVWQIQVTENDAHESIEAPADTVVAVLKSGEAKRRNARAGAIAAFLDVAVVWVQGMAPARASTLTEAPWDHGGCWEIEPVANSACAGNSGVVARCCWAMKPEASEGGSSGRCRSPAPAGAAMLAQARQRRSVLV